MHTVANRTHSLICWNTAVSLIRVAEVSRIDVQKSGRLWQFGQNIEINTRPRFATELRFGPIYRLLRGQDPHADQILNQLLAGLCGHFGECGVQLCRGKVLLF